MGEENRIRLADLLDRRIILAVLIIASLGAIHYVSFALSLPFEFRPLLDLQFKASLLGEFSLVSVFSWTLARYAPQALLALGAQFVTMVIEYKYLRRGYDTIPLPMGALRWRYVSDKEKRSEYVNRLKRFGRRSARFDNFVVDKIQGILPVLWYEKNKLDISYYLCVTIALLLLVGFSNSMVLFALATFLSGALSTYYGASDSFRFRLFGISYDGDKEGYEPPARRFGGQDLLIWALTAALLTAISGPMRLNKMKEDVGLLFHIGTESANGSIVGVTSAGIIFYDGRFRFVPYSGFTLEKPVD